MSYSKRKGYVGEKEAVEVLAEHDYEARRNGNLYGQADRGDIAGLPGWTIQVKSVSTARIPEYLKQAEEQAGRAGTGLFVVWLKLRGRHLRHGAAIMPVTQHLRLVAELHRLTNEISTLREERYGE